MVGKQETEDASSQFPACSLSGLDAVKSVFSRQTRFTRHDDKNWPRLAIVNLEFARRISGSVENSIHAYYAALAHLTVGSLEAEILGTAASWKARGASPQTCELCRGDQHVFTTLAASLLCQRAVSSLLSSHQSP